MPLEPLSFGRRQFLSPQESGLYEPMARLAEMFATGDAPAVIRGLDRLIRTRPEHQSLLLPLLGHLLLQRPEDIELAMSTLLKASRLAPSADNEADLIVGWLRLAHVDTARRRLTAALTDFCGDLDSALAEAARAFLRHAPSDHGFVVLTSAMRLHAEVIGRGAGEFEFRRQDGQVLAKLAPKNIDGWQGCSFKLRNPAAIQFVSAAYDGQSLLGGGRIFPVPFKADARSFASGRTISGWAHLPWNPSTPLSIEIRDGTGQVLDVRADRPGVAGRWHFECDLGAVERYAPLQFDLLLPDGRRFRFPDSPLMLKSRPTYHRRRAAPAVSDARSSRLSLAGSELAVDIIIPVYRDRVQTLACIDSVRKTLVHHPSVRIIVVDDASPEVELSADLDQLAEHQQIVLLRNSENLGFSASINRGMQQSRVRDAVLLNSDTLVFGDWLERLHAAARSHKRVGSVTPLADDDSVVSIANRAVPSSDPAELEQLDRYAATELGDAKILLPVGVGFCLYLRRDCWNDVGPFDAAAFPSGYGEECDWSMRAIKRGWTHRLAANVFVHHAGGGSFGSRRQALLERADRLLNLRHPGYDHHVQLFLRRDPLRDIRRRFDLYRLSRTSTPIVLVIMHALPGGVDRFVAERCAAIRATGKLPMLLRPSRYGPDSCMLWSSAPNPVEMQFRIPRESADLMAVLKALPIESMELHHFLGIDAQLLDAVLSLSIPYKAYLHDYSWICPRVTLIDESGRYCGEPSLRVCESCVQRNGSDLIDDISVRKLRLRSERWLSRAERVRTPSKDSKQRYQRYFPALRVQAEPLERDVESSSWFAAPTAIASPAEPIRVVLIGGIGEHKGYQVLLECARDARRRKLDIRFVVIGYTAKDETLQRAGSVFITGPYHDQEFPDLVRRERPDVIWLPSVWPETWCYTLTHAMRTGLPMVAFDIGAIAERLKKQRTGELLKLGESPQVINDRLIAAAVRHRQNSV